MQSITLFSVSFGILLLSGHANAADVGFEAGVFLEKNTNINLVPVNPAEETVTRTSAAIRVIELGPIFESRTDARVSNYEYRQDSYPSNTVKSVDTLNTFIIEPKRLTFNLDDHLAYVPIDSSALLTPVNQQQINLLSFGPSLVINASPVDNIKALFYKQKYYEQITNYDNKRDFVSTQIEHKLNKNSEVAVNYQYQSTDFDSNSIQDHKRSDIYISYLNQSASNRYSFEAGKSMAEFHDGISEDGNRFRLNLMRLINTGNNIQISYRDELSDVANELGFSQLVSSTHPVVVNSIPISNTGDVFRLKAAALDYTSASNPAQFHMGYVEEKVNYYQTPYDYEESRFSVDYTFPALDRIRVGISYVSTHRNILDLSRDYHIASSRLSINYYLSQDLFLNGYIGYEKNNSSDPAYDYKNKIYSVGLVYQTEKMRSIMMNREAMPGGIY